MGAVGTSHLIEGQTLPKLYIFGTGRRILETWKRSMVLGGLAEYILRTVGSMLGNVETLHFAISADIRGISALSLLLTAPSLVFATTQVSLSSASHFFVQ